MTHYDLYVHEESQLISAFHRLPSSWHHTSSHRKNLHRIAMPNSPPTQFRCRFQFLVFFFHVFFSIVVHGLHGLHGVVSCEASIQALRFVSVIFLPSVSPLSNPSHMCSALQVVLYASCSFASFASFCICCFQNLTTNTTQTLRCLL